MEGWQAEWAGVRFWSFSWATLTSTGDLAYTPSSSGSVTTGPSCSLIMLTTLQRLWTAIMTSWSMRCGSASTNST